MSDKTSSYLAMREVIISWSIAILSTVPLMGLLLVSETTIRLGFAKGMLAAAAQIPSLFLAAVVVGAVSVPQLLLLVWPMTKYLTQGLIKDANRNWLLYPLTGAVVGGVPWMLIVAMSSNGDAHLRDVVGIATPGLSIGAIAGVILKWRLLRLLARSAPLTP